MNLSRNYFSQLGVATLAILLISPTLLHAQYEAVELDPEVGWFNNGQALPTGKQLIISAPTEAKTVYAELGVWRGGTDHGKAPLYSTTWRRSVADQTPRLRMLFNYSLNGNSEYDFRFDLFRYLTAEEVSNLRQTLYSQFNAYLESVVASDKGGARQWESDLEKMVAIRMADYRSPAGSLFDEFGPALRRALSAYSKGSADTLLTDQKRRNQLARLLQEELSPLLDQPIQVKSSSFEVNQYRTETTRNPLGVSVGYGGVYLSGTSDNLSYDSAPFIGVSFPISNRAQSPAIFRHTAFCVGAFVNNFQDNQGREITGPVFKRPYFAGLGYQAFRFVRIQAGVTALEERTSGGSAFDFGNVRLQPYIGLSAELELWLGLHSRN